MTTKWVFEDFTNGIRAIFDSEKQAKKFSNKYRTFMYDKYEIEYCENDLMVYEVWYNPISPAKLIEAEES